MHLWGTSSIPKEVRIYNAETTPSSISGTVKIKTVTCKRMKLEHLLTPQGGKKSSK